MGRDDPAVLAPPEPTADAGRGHAAGPEPARETNAITSRLILLYVERVGGREAVRNVLRAAGLEDQGELLLDENYWFSDACDGEACPLSALSVVARGTPRVPPLS